jgi:hypothetical protein
MLKRNKGTRTYILAGLLVAFFPCFGFSQIGKTIDTAGQKQRIEMMPTDTSGLQQDKYQEPYPAGEKSDKNLEIKKPGEKKKERPQSQNGSKDGISEIAYYCKKCGRKSEKTGSCQKDGGELVKEGHYYCGQHSDAVQETRGKCPKCGKELKRMSRGTQ